MGLLGNSQDVDSKEIAGQETDTLGGNLFDSDLIQFQIKMAYLVESTNGALGLYIELEDENGRVFRNTEYFTNRNKDNFYLDKNTGDKKFLPGFTKLTSMCILATGKTLLQLEDDFEDRVVGVYNNDAKREVPTTVKVAVPLLKQGVRAGILKIHANKQTKNDAGDYVDTAEERIFNEIDRFFHFETAQTSSELQDDAEAAFFDKWVKANQGKVRDKYKEPKKGPATPGKAAATDGGTKKSLFAK